MVVVDLEFGISCPSNNIKVDVEHTLHCSGSYSGQAEHEKLCSSRGLIRIRAGCDG